MKVLLSWLRECVDVPGTADEIGATMSLRGFAVEGIERIGDDAVIDVEVTANRPDCMSIVGLAREVATAYGLPLRSPAGPPGSPAEAAAHGTSRGPADRGDGAAGAEQSSAGGPAGNGDLAITIEDPALCARYVGAVADVRVGPAPDWMQARLRAAGIRPISNIVDITNYVLLELGQPMHAFDRARLGGYQIRVRTARAGERLRTLDSHVRELSPGMLVIADATEPVAVAGVMGGGDSEVGDGTTTIVFESAYFDPLSVRRTSRTLGLKTEASMRFERGADPALPAAAMARACALLEQVGAGRRRGPIIDCHARTMAPIVLHLRRARVSGLLGLPVPDADITRILESLGFVADARADGWTVTVPPRRVDVAREVDLIEEVARHYGLDRVPVRFPAVVAAPPPIDPRVTRARQLRAVMTGAGFSEAMTFGFVGEAAAAPFAAADDLVPIANPLSENFSVLRPSALPGLVDAVARNRRREQRDVRLFEIGASFRRCGGERRTIACVWTGTIGGDHWAGGGRAIDFFDMKGAVERLCDALRVEVRTDPATERWLVPGRTAFVMAGDTRLGVLGQLSPELADRHDIPRGDAVYVAEIDLDAAEAVASGATRVEPLPRHPSVTRDISILVADTLPSAAVRQTVRDAAPDTLVRVREFDRYQGKGVADGQISLSLRFTFRSPDRTLTDAEVQDAMDQVLAALRENHGAVQR